MVAPAFVVSPSHFSEHLASFLSLFAKSCLLVLADIAANSSCILQLLEKNRPWLLANFKFKNTGERIPKPVSQGLTHKPINYGQRQSQGHQHKPCWWNGPGASQRKERDGGQAKLWPLDTMCCGRQGNRPRVRLPLPPLLSWVSLRKLLNLLCLHFLICVMGIVVPIQLEG